METANKRKGTIYMVLSSLEFALMQLFVKATASEIPLFEQVFMRNFMVMVMMIYTLHRHGNINKLKINDVRGILLLRCFSGFMGITLFFYAMRTIHLADAAAFKRALRFCDATLLCIAQGKADQGKVGGPLTAFVGVLLVVKP